MQLLTGIGQLKNDIAMRITTTLRIVASILIFGVAFQVVDRLYFMNNPAESEHAAIKTGLLVVSIGVVFGLYGLAAIIDRLDRSNSGS